MIDVAVLDMGGTINGILSPDTPPPTDSRVIPYVAGLEKQHDIRIHAQIVCLKDSRALELRDLHALADAIEDSPYDRVLVPHGTFTMSDTGTFLRDVLTESAQAKTVVLVGSAVPLGEPHSDAPGSLALALRALRTAGPGVWIAMDTRIWNPRGVRKDPATGAFIPESEG